LADEEYRPPGWRRIGKAPVQALAVSFVVPALNEEAYLGDTLEAIRAAMERNGEPWVARYEVIVVDDDSTDRTAETARRLGAKALSVRLRNIAAVRNAGAAAARGDWLCFVDADTQVNPALINEALAALAGGATWGGARLRASDRCPVWAEVLGRVYNAFHVGRKRWVYGSFCFIRRDVFLQVGGFPEAAPYGEDAALSQILLERFGPPAILRARAATSARKAVHFGFWRHMKILWLTTRYGQAAQTRPELVEYRDGEQLRRGR
jgi:glycosyltransferase involved in cell wall biosynthesis